jgi:hypothetical protein
MKPEQRQEARDPRDSSERLRRVLAATGDFLRGTDRKAKPARARDGQPSAERPAGLFTNTNTGDIEEQ